MAKEERYCPYCMASMDSATSVCAVCHRDSRIAPEPHHLTPGTRLNQGRYLVGRALGEGGFGITYIGRDLRLNMRVAIKEYYPGAFVRRGPDDQVHMVTEASAEDFDFLKGVEKFLEEARTMAMFSDKSEIVNVRDFFEEHGTAYIVMEYLDGITLKQYLVHSGRIPAGTVLRCLDPVLKALQEVHQHPNQVIHRDVSPDNIMLLRNGRLKLLDFGAAVELLGSTKSLSVMLKHGYAPLEQYGGKGQGPWTDVYAICATMYFCITGVRPDNAPNRVFNDDQLPPSALGVPITPLQEKALLRGLSVSWQSRTQSIAQLRQELGLEEGVRGSSLPWPVVIRTENLPDGGQAAVYQDGTRREKHPDGSTLISHPNGERTAYQRGVGKIIYDRQGGQTICDLSGMLKSYHPARKPPEPPRKIVKAPAQAAEIVYDGKAHRYAVPSTEDYTVTSEVRTGAGLYSVTISLKDKMNTVWENGGTGDLMHRFEIRKKPVPVPDQAGPVAYDGKPHMYPVSSCRYYTVEPVRETAAGTYAVRIALRDPANTVWEDGGTGEQIRSLRIVMARPEAETHPASPKKPARRRAVLAACAAAALLLLLLGAFCSRKAAAQRMEDSLPVERQMASDCADVLQSRRVNGGILDVEVREDQFREKTKAYSAECTVTVLKEDGSLASYDLELLYRYADGKWTLDASQSGVSGWRE